jgi:hypothetical protein
MVNESEDAVFNVLLVLARPNGENPVTLLPQLVHRLGIAPLICQKLLLPKSPVVLWQFPQRAAFVGVPKATMDKNRPFHSPVHKIRRAREVNGLRPESCAALA